MITLKELSIVLGDFAIDAVGELAKLAFGGEQNVDRNIDGLTNIVKGVDKMIEGGQDIVSARETYRNSRSLPGLCHQHQLEIKELSSDSEGDETGLVGESCGTSRISEEEGDRKLSRSLGYFERDYINPDYNDDQVWREKKGLWV